MTTPPQGPWGPGQPGGQPGGQHGGQGGPQQPGQPPAQQPQQGGWGQPPAQGGGWGQPPQQGRPQPGQPQQGQPQQGQPQQGQPHQGQPQQGGGWGQQPGQQHPQQGQQGHGQPAQGGWGQPPQQGGAYQQQSWGQRQQQGGQQGPQGGWHQQQGGQPGQWQPGGPNSKGPGGIGKDKMPLVIGGGVVGIVLIGLLVFLGIRAFGGDDTPTTQPTGGQTTGGDPTGKPTSSTSGGPGSNGELGNATGQAKTVTDKLQGAGFGCSDLFNTTQGAHRGCFKMDASRSSEALFQFKSDGTIIAVRIRAQDDENNNNAQVAFGQVLQAIGNDTFGGDQVTKIQQAVKTGQRDDEVGTTWGEFQLDNDGDSLQLSGHKSGEDSLDLPDQTFDTTQAQLVSALKAKGYVCTSSCRKDVGEYGSQRVYSYASEGKGIKNLELSASAEGSALKAAMTSAVNDAFGVVKGGNVAALKAYIAAHSDGKEYAAYVGGWKVEITSDSSGSYGSQSISIDYESFYA
jgi:hypothetical protein